MKKLKLALLTIIFCIQTIPAGTILLQDFTQLMTALKEGKLVRVVIDYSKCQLISNNEIQDHSPRATGGMTVDTFEFFEDNALGKNIAFVVSSESKLIANPKGDGYVYNYAKVKVDKENKVRLTARYIDPVTFEDKMDENFFTEMNNGKNDGAASFYLEK
ncbi:MAG: hypothetical protein JXQ65_05870 [Candidatus Marinimicrobia bacterium]|nr:hypothetical protein [Candidatus Neomarinimicrobiota bacterium]